MERIQIIYAKEKQSEERIPNYWGQRWTKWRENSNSWSHTMCVCSSPTKWNVMLLLSDRQLSKTHCPVKCSRNIDNCLYPSKYRIIFIIEKPGVEPEVAWSHYWVRTSTTIDNNITSSSNTNNNNNNNNTIPLPMLFCMSSSMSFIKAW